MGDCSNLHVPCDWGPHVGSLACLICCSSFETLKTTHQDPLVTKPLKISLKNLQGACWGLQKVTTSAAGSAGEEDPIRLRPVEGGRGRLDKISSNGLAELLHGPLQGQLREGVERQPWDCCYSLKCSARVL